MIIIAHRGDCSRSPENTLSAFRDAADAGADMIEFDVHCCASGEPVVIHDYTLERTTNGAGLVAAASLETLQGLDAGQGEPIPLLRDVLVWAQQIKKIGANIELKGVDCAPAVLKVLDQLGLAALPGNNIIISSFDRTMLKQVRLENTQVSIGVLTSEENDDWLAAATELKAYSLHPELSLLSAEMISTAHAHGLKVFPWSVDTADAMKHCTSMGVDGLFTYYPAIAKPA